MRALLSSSRNGKAAIFLSLVLMLIGWLAVLPARADSELKSIGQAQMTSDGTIVLYLQSRKSPSGGEVGQGVIIVRKTDPKYDDILDHLGGMKPGQVKNVPPWN